MCTPLFQANTMNARKLLSAKLQKLKLHKIHCTYTGLEMEWHSLLHGATLYLVTAVFLPQDWCVLLNIRTRNTSTLAQLSLVSGL